MTTLVYKSSDFSKNHPLVLTELTSGNGEYARFIFDGVCDGELRLGNMSISLTRGTAKVKLSALGEGKISPVLISGGRVYPLGELELFGGILKSAELLSREVIALRSALTSTQNKMLVLENRIQSLESIVGLARTFKI